MGSCKVVLLACGSFNPPTNMHLRMFELAKDGLHRMGQYWVVGGIISPVHDSYGKKELVSSAHRCEMLRLALRSSDWIRLSDWECNQESWNRTVQVLQHHQNTINSAVCNNNRERVRGHNEDSPDFVWMPGDLHSTDHTATVKLLCGGDLLESFSTPGLWKDSDIETIVGQHGLVVITREGSNPHKFIYESDLLTRYQRNIIIIPEWIYNDVSSSKIRRALRRQESVRYLIDDNVIDYIAKHQLFGFESLSPKYGAKDGLSIPINSYTLTPSPNDVPMRSVSPSKADQDITLTLQPFSVIDVPDTVQLGIESSTPAPKREFKLKNDTEVVLLPGKTVKTLPVDIVPGKIKKVGFADETESAKKVMTAIKQTPEVQKAVIDNNSGTSDKSTKTKKAPRLSDPTRSRNVFKRSNSDVPTFHSNPDLEATAVKIEFTKEGIKVISDKESIV